MKLFLVRSKHYIFLESLEHYKKAQRSVQCFLDISSIFRTRILWHHVLQSAKYQLFQNVAYFIWIERLFSTDQLLLKGLGVYDSCSQVRGFKMKIMTSKIWYEKYGDLQNVTYLIPINMSDVLLKDFKSTLVWRTLVLELRNEKMMTS